MKDVSALWLHCCRLQQSVALHLVLHGISLASTYSLLTYLIWTQESLHGTLYNFLASWIPHPALSMQSTSCCLQLTSLFKVIKKGFCEKSETLYSSSKWVHRCKPHSFWENCIFVYTRIWLGVRNCASYEI